MRDERVIFERQQSEFSFGAWHRELVIFKPDGTMVLGEGVTPTEAAREFWEMVQATNPYRPQRLVELEAENAALREIVQWVADVPWYITGDGYACAGCDKEGKHPATIQHLPDCRVLKARALLAGE